MTVVTRYLDDHGPAVNDVLFTANTLGFAFVGGTYAANGDLLIGALCLVISGIMLSFVGTLDEDEDAEHDGVEAADGDGVVHADVGD